MVEKIGVGLKNDLPAGFLFDGTKVTACNGQCHPVLPHSNFYFLQKKPLERTASPAICIFCKWCRKSSYSYGNYSFFESNLTTSFGRDHPHSGVVSGTDTAQDAA
jgi:hypothetical protein